MLSKRFLGPVAISSSLVLAACGGDGSSSPAAEPESSTFTVAVSESLEPFQASAVVAVPAASSSLLARLSEFFVSTATAAVGPTLEPATLSFSVVEVGADGTISQIFTDLLDEADDDDFFTFSIPVAAAASNLFVVVNINGEASTLQAGDSLPAFDGENFFAPLVTTDSDVGDADDAEVIPVSIATQVIAAALLANSVTADAVADLSLADLEVLLTEVESVLPADIVTQLSEGTDPAADFASLAELATTVAGNTLALLADADADDAALAAFEGDFNATIFGLGQAQPAGFVAIPELQQRLIDTLTFAQGDDGLTFAINFDAISVFEADVGLTAFDLPPALSGDALLTSSGSLALQVPGQELSTSLAITPLIEDPFVQTLIPAFDGLLVGSASLDATSPTLSPVFATAPEGTSLAVSAPAASPVQVRQLMLAAPETTAVTADQLVGNYGEVVFESGIGSTVLSLGSDIFSTNTFAPSILVSNVAVSTSETANELTVSNGETLTLVQDEGGNLTGDLTLSSSASNGGNINFNSINLAETSDATAEANINDAVDAIFTGFTSESGQFLTFATKTEEFFDVDAGLKHFIKLGESDVTAEELAGKTYQVVGLLNTITTTEAALVSVGLDNVAATVAETDTPTTSQLNFAPVASSVTDRVGILLGGTLSFANDDGLSASFAATDFGFEGTSEAINDIADFTPDETTQAVMFESAQVTLNDPTISLNGDTATGTPGQIAINITSTVAGAEGTFGGLEGFVSEDRSFIVLALDVDSVFPVDDAGDQTFVEQYGLFYAIDVTDTATAAPAE